MPSVLILVHSATETEANLQTLPATEEIEVTVKLTLRLKRPMPSLAANQLLFARRSGLAPCSSRRALKSELLCALWSGLAPWSSRRELLCAPRSELAPRGNC